MTAVGLGALYWVVEALVHVLVFRQGTLVQQLFMPDANEIWMRSVVAAVLIAFGACVQRVMTQRGRAEEAVRREHQQLLSVFDAIHESVYVPDPHNHEILYADQAMKERLGDVVGQKCYRAIQGRDSPCPFCTNDAIFGDNAGRPHIWELHNKRDLRWYRCIDKAIRWSDGRMVRLGMAIDITEFKQARETLQKVNRELETRVEERTRELRQANEQLLVEIAQRKQAEEQLHRHQEELEEMVQARTARIQELEQQRAATEKLAATGRMAARIAHEINNPLAGIKNSFLLIKDAISEDHPYYEYVARIERETDRIANIVRQMYDLYQPAQEAACEVRVDEAIRDVVALLDANSREREVTIAVEVPETARVVCVPPGSLCQVLFNLVRNAIEASPPGAPVKVTAADHDGSLTITITDRGDGIPPDLAPRVFEPFFTTKGGAGEAGLGLGLSISRSLVEAMGGRLDFECEPGRETVFRVILPREPGPEEVHHG